MAQKAAIKSRIKSINATKKITGAMELIATVKLQKQRNHMLKNREYLSILKDTMSNILSGDIDVESSFLNKKDNNKKAVIVFVSDIGLCGGYNINIQKLFNHSYDENDYVFVVGTANYNFFKNNYNVVNTMISSDSTDFNELKKTTDQAIELFKNNEVGSIEVVYTEFVNNIVFEPRSETILPCNKNEFVNKKHKEVLLEPSASEILNHLIPMYVENSVYAKWLEAKTSEQGARRFAMENATDNANELTDELLLEYNQARQAAITQEISEIVGGAEAL